MRFAWFVPWLLDIELGRVACGDLCGANGGEKMLCLQPLLLNLGSKLIDLETSRDVTNLEPIACFHFESGSKPIAKALR